MKTDAPILKKRGRPRGFDRDAALEAAMRTFWAHGYETTSIADLTAAMGINAPAIYSAFGDKERLFLEALARYRGDPKAEAKAIADAPSAKEAAHMILRWAVALFTGITTPRGCLVATSLATGSESTQHIRTEGTAIRQAVERNLAERIMRDVEEGALPPDTDAEVLAAFVVCTVQGLSTLARDNASPEKLKLIADRVLMAWP